MSQFLQSIDQFGVQQKLQIPPSNPTQKSAVGGLVTLILYSASFAYFIYQLYDWQSNHKLPKYFTVKTQIDEHKRIDCNQIFAEIINYEQEDDRIDPFDPLNMIILPELKEVQAYEKQIQKSQPELIQQAEIDGTKTNKFIFQNITFVGEPQKSRNNNQIDYEIKLRLCDEKNQNGFKCASKELILKYFEQDENLLQINIFLQQFNFREKKLITTPKTYFIEVLNDTLQYKEFHLIINTLDINDGILFSNSNIIDYMTDVTIQELQFNQNHSIQDYGEELYALLYFSIDQFKEESVIEYAKISEILADTVTMISFIMQISFFVQNYNQHLCMQIAIKEIITMYYKDFGQFKIKKNWKGSIIQVSKAGQIIKHKNIIDFFTKLEMAALKKINFLNIQHEVSLIQIFITKLLNFEQINTYKKTIDSIGQLIQTKISNEPRSFSINRNQIFPEIDMSKQQEDDTLNIYNIEQDLYKTILLLAFNQKKEIQDINLEVFNNSVNELQILNLDSSTIQ